MSEYLTATDWQQWLAGTYEVILSTFREQDQADLLRIRRDILALPANDARLMTLASLRLDLEGAIKLAKVKAEIASFGHQVRTAPGTPGHAIFDGQDKCVAGCPGYTMTLDDLEAWARKHNKN